MYKKYNLKIGKEGINDVCIKVELKEKETNQLNFETLKEVEKTLIVSTVLYSKNFSTPFFLNLQEVSQEMDFKLLKNITLEQIEALENLNLYHLNDLKAGTKKQTELLKGLDLNYKEACAFLEKNGLLEDKGYKYGTKWLFEELNEESIFDLMKKIGEWENGN